jgi:hypothetical protein
MDNAAHHGHVPPPDAEAPGSEPEPAAIEAAVEPPTRLVERPEPGKRIVARADELDDYADAHLELVLLAGLGGVLLGIAWSCLLVLLIADPPPRAVPLFRSVTIAGFVLFAGVAGIATVPFLKQSRIRRRWQRGVRRRRGQEHPPTPPA